MIYNPRNWYWLVADNAMPYSSAANAYVQATDPVYMTWRAKSRPTKIASAALLNDVLTQRGLSANA